MRKKLSAEKQCKTESKPETQVGEALTLDFPQEDEMIVGSNYTFRIGTAGQTLLVEVGIDRDPWKPCRRDSGYWWYDWSGFTPGYHLVRARTHTQDGRVEMTLLRRFKVSKHG